MEDEKGLVAREWLYTKVFGVDTVDSNHDDDRNGDNGKFLMVEALFLLMT